MKRTLTSKIQSILWSKPRLYDATKRAQRAVLRRHTPAYSAIDRFSRELGGSVRFIQIGANDGLRNDPIREFIVRDDWSGVLVEPLPYAVSLLRANYPARRFPNLKFVNAAATTRDGSALRLWSASDDYLGELPRERRLELLRKASVDREHVIKFLPPEAVANGAIVQLEVPAVTIESLAQTTFPGGQFDLLVVDAEGHEPAILRSIDFQQTRPKAIFFESQHLGSEQKAIENLLRVAGYDLQRVAGDSFATLRDN